MLEIVELLFNPKKAGSLWLIILITKYDFYVVAVGPKTQRSQLVSSQSSVVAIFCLLYTFFFFLV